LINLISPHPKSKLGIKKMLINKLVSNSAQMKVLLHTSVGIT